MLANILHNVGRVIQKATTVVWPLTAGLASCMHHKPLSSPASPEPRTPCGLQYILLQFVLANFH